MDPAPQDRPVPERGELREPLVSVLLPVHNGEAYLAAAIESILKQTYSKFELIIVDDGSSDGSAEIAAGFEDPRVVVVRNEANLGLVETLNRGLTLARGELIARMDADDIADARRFEMQVRRFQRDPGIVALGTAIACIDESGHATTAPGRLALRPAVIRWRLLRGTCLYHPTMMLSRARAGDDARYASEFVHAEDYELLLRLSRRHDLDNLPERLLAQRVHGGSVSSRFREVQLDSAARALVLHARQRYGLEVAPGRAKALLDPRRFFGPASSDADSPVGLVLELERHFRGAEPGLAQEDVAAVRRDVAFFLWKLTAISLTDWRNGRFLARRAKALLDCAWALLRRPGAALAALAWR
jgi:glycosyltransferase involved in cell wall biosynthesis